MFPYKVIYFLLVLEDDRPGDASLAPRPGPRSLRVQGKDEGWVTGGLPGLSSVANHKDLPLIKGRRGPFASLLSGDTPPLSLPLVPTGPDPRPAGTLPPRLRPPAPAPGRAAGQPLRPRLARPPPPLLASCRPAPAPRPNRGRVSPGADEVEARGPHLYPKARGPGSLQATGEESTESRATGWNWRPGPGRVP